jgi:transcriptional regulator with XRE-family HTH domain
MKDFTLDELNEILAADQEYRAAERALRPELNLANDVIVCRVEAGLTQVALARAVGTNQANISRLESGVANPTLKFLKKVARALDADLDVRLRRRDDVGANETLQAFVTRIDAPSTTVTIQDVVFAPTPASQRLITLETGAGRHCR